MDKNRIAKIAERECSDIERFRSGNEYTFSEYSIQQFAAAILLEAADICQQVSEGNDTSAEYCQYRLEQLAKELTK